MTIDNTVRPGGPYDDEIRVDPILQALAVISEVHSMIHRSRLWSHWTVIENLSAGNSYDHLLHVITPVHMRIEVSASAESIFSIYEGVTVGNQGTTVTAYNRNRASNSTTDLVISHNPTVVASGVLLGSMLLQGGNKSGSNESFDEWILPSGDYIVRLKNNSNGNANIGVEFNYYHYE